MEVGSLDTLEMIYSNFYRKSFFLVKSYVNDQIVAEDIVSESLIKLWNRINYEPIDNVQFFLLRLLKNASMDHLKHEAIKQKAISSIKENLNYELNDQICDLKSCNPNEVYLLDIKRIIQKTLAKVPERSRMVFNMSRFEDKSYKEIAKSFNITVKGVDYHIAIVIKALRVALKDYLPVCSQ